MVLIEQNGIQKKTLCEYGLISLQSIKIQCYWFTFGPMKEVDATSILIRMQHYHNQGVLESKNFIDFLRARKIAFKVRWIPCLVLTFEENLLHFLFIAKYNLITK